MYHGKHSKRSRGRSGKSVTLLVSLLLIVTVTVGGAVAFLLDSTGPIQNLFNPSKVTTKVEEEFNHKLKENVKIKNTGDTEAWIRAAVVINWQDQDGEIYGEPIVEGKDYEIEYDLENGWVLGGDGFYYWTLPVEPGKETGVLITRCFPSDHAAPGYNLNVEIIGSGIQSKPLDAFNEAWATSGLKVDVTDPADMKLVKEAGQ